MLSANDKVRDYLNVTTWHNSGYKGENGYTATAEQINASYFDEEQVIRSYNTGASTDHGTSTALVFLEIAPLRKLVVLNSSTTLLKLESDIEIIKNLEIDTKFECLSTQSKVTGRDEYLEQVADYFSHFVSIGNEDDDEYNLKASDSLIYAVGACSLNDDGSLEIKSYSSESEHCDFVSITELYVENRTLPFTGTSCSTPVLVGMCALVNDFFIQNTGYPLSSASMYQFVMDNCHDINDSGFDEKTGHGIFILPDPWDIDTSKYQSRFISDEIFTDSEDISTWAKDSINYCVMNELLEGKGDKFCPKDSLTREEIAVVLKRILLKMKGEN